MNNENIGNARYLMEKNRKLFLFILLAGFALMTVPDYFGTDYKYLMSFIGLSIVFSPLIWHKGAFKNEGFISERSIKVFFIVFWIGFAFTTMSHYLNGAYKVFLLILGAGVVLSSFLIGLISLSRAYTTCKAALKDAFRLSEEDFSGRISGYADIQLLFIIDHPSYKISNKLPIVYKELLGRDLCDQQEVDSQRIKYISKDDWKGSDYGIWFKLTNHFLLVAGSDGFVRYNSLLIRISEIESIVFSKWIFIRPPYFHIYYKRNGNRMIIGLLSPSHNEDWKKAFESVGLKVEERIRGKNKGKEELSNVTQ